MSKTLKNTGSASCTRGFIPQWKLIEGTAWFSNTEILVLSVIAAAEKFIWINNLDFSPLPPCLRSEKLAHVKITFCLKNARIHLRKIFYKDRSTRHKILSEKNARPSRAGVSKPVCLSCVSDATSPTLHHIVARASAARIQYKLPL
ncbi:hypothetical protein Y032_0080g1361 [Ancylostoma ceylanicum]|uniref:Uncharacterized protein n=1 Tax=Ancylostoma ceylanicum TaxID=53326 RepID=A0A016TSQ4_9BILA|nr:hypothetical protein Y032_0080g1361 [Ancylostoma ceylanicum]